MTRGNDNNQLPTVAKRLPPSAGRGRKKGEVNKTTRVLKEAILLAAQETGQDGKGKGGLTGYCRFLAAKEPKAFATLLGRVLPLQVEGTGADGAITFRTIYENA